MNDNINIDRLGWHSVVKYVATPLHFLAFIGFLLIACVLMLAWGSNLPPDETVLLIKILILSFISLVVITLILFIFMPEKLVFDKEAHITVMREKLGDHELPAPYITGTLPNAPPVYLVADMGETNEEETDMGETNEEEKE